MSSIVTRFAIEKAVPFSLGATEVMIRPWTIGNAAELNIKYSAVAPQKEYRLAMKGIARPKMQEIK